MPDTAPRPLHFAAFVMNTTGHIIQGTWRRPTAEQADFNSLDHWVDLAKTLERGKFDAIFFADVVGLYADYRGDARKYFEAGLQVPSNDPSVLASAIAYATEHLGIAFTASILQEHPFNFARRISTLDHASKGRVAWNIVTNYLPNASRNFGLEGLTKHDERYAWADEYVDVTYKLWEGSWEEDALRPGPRVRHPRRLRQGPQDQPRGPALPGRGPAPGHARARSARRCSSRPVPPRRAATFAAKNAEAVFIQSPNLDAAARDTTDIRARAVQHGRRAEDLKFFQGLYVVPGSTEEEAKRKAAELDEWIDYDAQLSHMSGAVGIDFGHEDLDKPIGELKTEGVQSIVGWIKDLVPDRPADPARRRALHRDQQPHRRHARADRRRARALAGRRRRRDQPRQRRDPRQLRGLRRPRHPGAAGARPRAEGVRRGDPAPEAVRAGRPAARAPPGGPLPRRLRARWQWGARCDRPRKRLVLNLFEMNCVSHITHGLWRLPDNNRERFNDIEYWTELAKLLEDGGFDAVFLADVVGTYDTFRGSADTAIRRGPADPEQRPGRRRPGDGRGDQAPRLRHHLLHDLRAAVRVGPPCLAPSTT